METLHFYAAARRRDGDYRGAIGYQPFISGRRDLEQLALLSRGEHLSDRLLTFGQHLYVFRDAIPDLGPLEELAENADFHVDGAVGNAVGTTLNLIGRDIFGANSRKRLFKTLQHRLETLFLKLLRARRRVRFASIKVLLNRFRYRLPGEVPAGF
jgi:hypothetical protein